VSPQWLSVDRKSAILKGNYIICKQFNPTGRAIKSAHCKPVELLCLLAIIISTLVFMPLKLPLEHILLNSSSKSLSSALPHCSTTICVIFCNEIRKDKGVFKMLNNQEKKNSFIGKLSDVVNQQKFEVISATIQKEAHAKRQYKY
jgi:hypothetical protein